MKLEQHSPQVLQDWSFEQFPHWLAKVKKENSTCEIMEIFKHICVNIPLLDTITQVPSYAKFLKDLSIKKKSIYIQKKVFLTENINSILQ